MVGVSHLGKLSLEYNPTTYTPHYPFLVNLGLICNTRNFCMYYKYDIPIMTWLDLDSLGQNNHQAIGPFYQSIAQCPSHCHFSGKRFPVTISLSKIYIHTYISIHIYIHKALYLSLYCCEDKEEKEEQEGDRE